MTLIDAHTHVWGADRDELPWVVEMLPPEWEGQYSHIDLIADMSRTGVDEAVIVTTPLYGRGKRANEYTMRSIEAHPDRLYGVGLMDFFGDEKIVREDVRQVVGHERMLGVRFHAALDYGEIPGDVNRTGDWITDERLDPVWEELATTDACAFVFPKADQLPLMTNLAKKHSDVTYVVDHMAWPDETTAPNEAPWNVFADLAEHSNVFVKVSSLPRSSKKEWPYEDLHGYVRNLLEWFGPERLQLGSDYPWMDSWAPYEDCLSWVDAMECLSRRDQAYLSYRTFRDLHC